MLALFSAGEAVPGHCSHEQATLKHSKDKNTIAFVCLLDLQRNTSRIRNQRLVQAAESPSLNEEELDSNTERCSCTRCDCCIQRRLCLFSQYSVAVVGGVARTTGRCGHIPTAACTHPPGQATFRIFGGDTSMIQITQTKPTVRSTESNAGQKQSS